jgi:hypothetical protein
MNEKGQFTKIEKSEERMYGPRGLLICGYPEEERDNFCQLVETTGLTDIRIVFTCTHDLGETVGDILGYADKAGLAGDSAMPRAVIMSGLTQNELHHLMASYRGAGLARQLWATLTPVSEKWSLESLLNELQAEHEAMKNKPKS